VDQRLHFVVVREIRPGVSRCALWIRVGTAGVWITSWRIAAGIGVSAWITAGVSSSRISARKIAARSFGCFNLLPRIVTLVRIEVPISSQRRPGSNRRGRRSGRRGSRLTLGIGLSLRRAHRPWRSLCIGGARNEEKCRSQYPRNNESADVVSRQANLVLPSLTKLLPQSSQPGQRHPSDSACSLVLSMRPVAQAVVFVAKSTVRIDRSQIVRPASKVLASLSCGRSVDESRLNPAIVTRQPRYRAVQAAKLAHAPCRKIS
jgi:hypothetical protein